MTDILVRICVGACGLGVLIISGGVAIDNQSSRGDKVKGGIVALVAQVAILRALGVL